MAGFPQEFIDTIREKADVVDVVSRRVKLRKAGRDYVGLCPFHEEKTPSFTVSPAKQFYHCFGCGAHGNAIDFLMERDGMSFVDAVETLAEEIGVPVPTRSAESAEEKGRREREVRLLDILERAKKHFFAALRDSAAAVEYAKSRGLTGETARLFNIGYAPGDILSALPDVPSSDLLELGLLALHDDSGEVRDKFRQRLMFPIQDERGRVIGFGGRVIGDGKPKYLNSPESAIFHKGHELYGLTQAKQAIREERSAVLLEGYMDVVMLHQHGEKRAVAALGTSLTQEQVRRLFRLANEIVFCFDGDKAGQAAAASAAKIVLAELTDGKSAKFVILPTEHDPDSFVREHGIATWCDLLDKGMPLSAWVTKQLLSTVAGHDVPLGPETRTAVAMAAQEFIALAGKAPMYREALTQHIEGMVGFKLPRTAPETRSGGQRQKPSTKSVVAQPGTDRSVIYANIALLEALGVDTTQDALCELLKDAFSELIVGWFGIAPPDCEGRLALVGQVGDPALRTVLRASISRAEEIRLKGQETVSLEIEALLSALGRVADRLKKYREFGALFDSE